MTQIVPATAILGPGQTSLTLGYRVLNLDGTQYSAFTTTGVAETATPGTYRVADGVAAPDAGGYVVFGTAGVDLAEATVGSAASVDVSALALETTAQAIRAAVVDALPDSYAVDGVQPSLTQAILTIYQFLLDRSVSGTTVTVLKPDGATTALTLTLDSASSPTSITRTG